MQCQGMGSEVVCRLVLHVNLAGLERSVISADSNLGIAVNVLILSKGDFPR